MTLSEALDDPPRRDRIVADCVRMVDQEVAGKRGLSGAALRTGYGAFLRVRPGIVGAAVARLLPAMTPVIEPHWAHAEASGDPDRYFRDQRLRIADDLLGVTDVLAERASNRVLVRIYRTLRSSARDHVGEAIPRLPGLFGVHLR